MGARRAGGVGVGVDLAPGLGLGSPVGSGFFFVFFNSLTEADVARSLPRLID
jgi:hypothetical protein